MRKNPYIDIINANGHSFVEIGGVKWATCNLGANYPWEPGLYFQWGDTRGYSFYDVGKERGEKKFIASDYRFVTNDTARMTKYNADDRKTELDLEDDAVNAAWGGKWRIAKQVEFERLTKETNHKWTNNYKNSGMSGLIFLDKDNQTELLFFPGAGFGYVALIVGLQEYGGYWANSLGYGNIYETNGFFFNSKHVSYQNFSTRYFGYSVRGVLDC